MTAPAKTPAPTARIVPSAHAGDWVTPSLAAACCVNMVSTMSVSAFLPSIAADLGTSVAVLGQIPSLTMLLAAALGLVAGPLADRYGYRTSVVLGLVTSGVSGLGLALAPALVPLFLAGLLGAAGRAIIMPTAQAIVAVTVHEEAPRRKAISWIATGQTAAPLIGIPIMTAVAAISHWRISFVVLVALAFGLATILWWMLPPDARSTSRLRLRDVLAAYGPLLRHRPSVVLILAMLLANVGSWATFTYLAVFFVQVHDFSTAEVGGAYLVCGIGTVLGTRVVGTRLGAHARLLQLGGRILGAVCLLSALTLAVPPLVALALLSVVALTATMCSASTVVLLASDAPGGRGTALTLLGSGLSLGTAIGAAVGGLILTFSDFRAIGVVSTAFIVVSALLIWRFHGPSPVEDQR